MGPPLVPPSPSSQKYDYVIQTYLWLFRWFKFTLKPPYTVAIENLLSLIWDTSHWNFFLKFGLKTAYDMS